MNKEEKQTRINQLFVFNLSDRKAYSPSDIVRVLELSLPIEKEREWITNGRGENKVKVLNIPFSFDTETTSFLLDETDSIIDSKTVHDDKINTYRKCGIMYAFMLGINGRVILGRTYDELLYCLWQIQEYLHLSSYRQIYMYTHNLPFDFQFIRKHIRWDKIFAMDKREIVTADSSYGISFRCSLKLSGMSLANIGKKLTKYKIEKLVGDLDYSKIRHSKTPLTEEEVGYCINDVKVLNAYIKEKIEEDGNITKIPLTKTGYVRRHVRKECYGANLTNDKDKFARNKQYREYSTLMNSLTLTHEMYNLCKNAFAGGHTHGNAWRSCRVYNDVFSDDLTSSYPTVMISELFPMSKPLKITIRSKAELESECSKYCCIFVAKLYNLKSIVPVEHIISKNKCLSFQNIRVDNGRIIEAENIMIAMTNIDYFNFKKFYSWKSMKVTEFYSFIPGYLPKPIIESVLYFYEGKTKLKDVKGQEREYMRLKELLNSMYGMIVTDPCKDDVIYDNDFGWDKIINNTDDLIDKYNKSKNRFLIYFWGLFITAYARRNLYTAILELGFDYIYSDTDSVKYLNRERHISYFNDYNERIAKRIDKCLSFYKIDVERSRPKNKYGEVCQLGVWSYEGKYDKFKFLGAKRYMTYKDNKLNITVSGLNKNITVPYILKMVNNDIDKAFEFFSDDMYIPREYTGKMIHTYDDTELIVELTDYTGIKTVIREKSFIHLIESKYDLTLSDDYIELLHDLEFLKVITF